MLIIASLPEVILPKPIFRPGGKGKGTGGQLPPCHPSSAAHVNKASINNNKQYIYTAYNIIIICLNVCSFSYLLLSSDVPFTNWTWLNLK